MKNKIHGLTAVLAAQILVVMPRDATEWLTHSEQEIALRRCGYCVSLLGQPATENTATVRVITYFGTDNPIDGIVLDVLIRKHNRIRNRLGISVPVPINTDSVTQAILEVSSAIVERNDTAAAAR